MTQTTRKTTVPKRTRTKANSKAGDPTGPGSPGEDGPRPRSTDGLKMALRALELGLEKKGMDPVLLDVGELCSFCNYQLVLSGRSDRQVEAIADGIVAGLREAGERPYGKEPARTGQWALLDYGDFVVHVFLHSIREHYDLEGLWNDAPRVPIVVPEDARMPTADPYGAITP